MSSFRGRMPDIVYLIAFTAAVLWAPGAGAEQRVPLTLAEAQDLALAGEPGEA